MPMATKFDRVEIHKKEAPSKKSQDALITLSCKVTRNIRCVVSLISQGLWPPKLARWRLTIRSLNPQGHTFLSTRDHFRSSDKSKTLCLLCNNAYSHQI